MQPAAMNSWSSQLGVGSLYFRNVYEPWTLTVSRSLNAPYSWAGTDLTRVDPYRLAAAARPSYDGIFEILPQPLLQHQPT
jgi:hypothetical protein